MMDDVPEIKRLLLVEKEFTDELAKTAAAQQLHGIRRNLLGKVRAAEHSGNTSLIIATERAIVEGDLSRYTNSQPMATSLKTAINEIAAIERHIGIVDDQVKYRAVNEAHSLPKNRKSGLPLDEARQALASHYTRLSNLDKSRLGDDEKRIISARKSAIFAARKFYSKRQSQALGITCHTAKNDEIG